MPNVKSQQRRKQSKNPKSKGGISEATAIAGAMAGGAIGATVAASVTSGELKKRLVKLFSSPKKNQKTK